MTPAELALKELAKAAQQYARQHASEVWDFSKYLNARAALSRAAIAYAKVCAAVFMEKPPEELDHHRQAGMEVWKP